MRSSTKFKFIIFLFIFLILLGIGGYLVYKNLYKDNEKIENDIEEEETYVHPNKTIIGDVLEIEDGGIGITNRSNTENEYYYLTEDSICKIIDAENSSEESCDYESLFEGKDTLLGLGAKLEIIYDTDNIKEIRIYISET